MQTKPMAPFGTQKGGMKMNRKWKQFIAIVALSCVLISNQVLATPSKDIDKKMEDVKNDMEKNKEELSEINDEIGATSSF